VIGIVFVCLVLVVLFAIARSERHHHRIRRFILQRLGVEADADSDVSKAPPRYIADTGLNAMSEEEKSEAELRVLLHRIEDRKQIARDTDLLHHLWGFYAIFFRNEDLALGRVSDSEGKWYDVNVTHAVSHDGLNEFRFELMGDRYRFVDDEDRHGWCENYKFFSLFLYDADDRCLVEVPIKRKVDKRGSTYTIATGGPKAFLPGDWVHNFINVKLKHQHMRNQDIRAQKHQERLWEIEDLKGRFGISD
jgi:hypothetical protein